MKLRSIQSIVEKYAKTISEVLDVGVMVVDEHLERIGDTYKYKNEPTPVKENSIIGSAIAQGKPMTVASVRDCDICRACSYYDTCDLFGVMAVPIWLEEEIVGGFCVVILEHRKDLLDHPELSIDFLENMASLLSEKLKNAKQYQALEAACREQEVIMNVIQDALVSTDANGRIDYCNEAFTYYFGGKGDMIGQYLYHVVRQPVMDELIRNPFYNGDRLIYNKNSIQGHSFYGFVYCHCKNGYGPDHGLLFTFRSISNINSDINELSSNKVNMDFDWISYQSAESPSMLRNAKQIAITDEIALLEGESGLGKDVLAKAMHNFSNRSDEYFVNVDCGDLSADSLEKEIFGHVSSKKHLESIGKLRLAHKGTIFFRNVNLLPLYLQEQIACFIKTRRIEDSSKEDIAIDARMIFSSTEDLGVLVDRGHFSENLYYRISKNRIKLLPVRFRDRSEIHTILTNAIQFMVKKHQKPNLRFDIEAIELLKTYSWPGNLQQLWNCIDRIVYSCKETVFEADLVHMEPALSSGPENASVVKSLGQIEKEQISRLLKQGYHKDQIAEMLNISRATLYRKIKKYKLS